MINQKREDFEERPYFMAIRAKLAEGLREQYDLTDPMPKGLLELLSQLETSVRDITRERLYAEFDECGAALLHAADRKSGAVIGRGRKE
jgi:hypothetical protein